MRNEEADDSASGPIASGNLARQIEFLDQDRYAWFVELMPGRLQRDVAVLKAARG